ncbi:hypothetical protein DUNSADRAFT_13863 [Dunaliella salina]|uniref:F-box domain-containing protein n=1 Tax=Dunaliella salina TaxID=3046 RepID=A0ABQ7H2Y0_DUNSA|nr:hypothetical protein DUNSADRAFT_13863 [Dunaliella salina]|eukprot:KAF5841218.1 hypothetical protein DUNSADRAFT_13863 [Dunaliella salina]
MSTHECSIITSLMANLPDALLNVVQYLSSRDRRSLAAVCNETRELCNGMERSICLTSHSFLSAQPIIFGRFPALVHLKCVDGGIDDERLSHFTGPHLTKGLQRLKSFSVTQCSYLSTWATTALLAMASKLEHLALGRWACTASILGFPASLCTSLRILDFGDDQVDVESMDDTALQVLSGLCTSVQKLSLSRCVNITDAGSLSAMRRWVLDASHCCSLGDDALEGLALGGAPCLKHLMLERCAITNEGLSVCSQMPHLECLDLGPSFEATSAGLQCLGRCRALQSLCLGNLVIQHEVQGMGPSSSSGSSSTTTIHELTATNSSNTNNSAATTTTATTSLTTSRGECSGRSSLADMADTNSQCSCIACGCRHQGPGERGRGAGTLFGVPERGTQAGTPNASPSSCLRAYSMPGRGTEAGTPHEGPCSCPALAASSQQAVHVPSNGAPRSQGPTMFPSLKRLQFGGSFFTCGLHMVFPMAPIGSLTSVRVRGYSTVVGPHMVSLANQKGIEHLELHGGYTLSPEDCLPLVRGLPRLRKLTFACCPLVTPKAASHLLSVSSSSCLAVIELRRSGGTEGSGGGGTRQSHGCEGEDIQEIRRS